MIKLLITIYNNEKKFKNILKKYKLPFNIMTYGNGTASSSLLAYFGLDEVKKNIYFSLLPSQLEITILKEIENKLSLKEEGKGIAFTISLTSSNKFINDNLKGEDVMEAESEYELIVVIVKEGYSDLVMQAAKKEGASGGTIIDARSLGSSRSIFLNLDIDANKDLVLIIVPKNIRNKVMQIINKETGIKTDAHGLLMSLPIDNLIGLHE